MTNHITGSSIFDGCASRHQSTPRNMINTELQFPHSSLDFTLQQYAVSLDFTLTIKLKFSLSHWKVWRDLTLSRREGLYFCVPPPGPSYTCTYIWSRSLRVGFNGVQYCNTVLTIVIVRLELFLWCLLLIVSRVSSTVSLCSFYFCRLIGKLTVFFQLQKVKLQNPPSTSVCRRMEFSSQIKSKLGHILTKTVVLHMYYLNIDDTPIVSRLMIIYSPFTL